MPKAKYTYRRTNNWSSVEKALLRGGWPFVILDNKRSIPKVMLAVASDGMGPAYPAAQAFAEHVTRLLNGTDTAAEVAQHGVEPGPADRTAD